MSAHKTALRRIEEARATAASVLDLGNLALDSLPLELARLPALRVLALGAKAPRQEGTELLWRCDFDRQVQRFTDLAQLKELPGLQMLSLSRCESLTSVDVLKELPGLQMLSLFWCKSLTNVDVLKELPGLQTLDLAGCTSLMNVDVLKELPGLRTLDLSWCKSLTSVDGLKELPGLQTLDLSWCTSLKSVDGLKELPGLQTLNLAGCTSLTNVDGLKELPGGLQTLDLGQCMSLTNVDGLKELPGLQTLNMAWCTSLTNVDVLKELPGLRTLYLSRCESLANMDVLKELPGLQTLNLAGFTSLTNVDVVKELPGLQTLNMAGCTSLTSVDGLRELPGLQTLDLAGCTSLTSVDGLRELPGLQTLDLAGCTSLTSVDGLKELPGLQTLNLAKCTSLKSVDGLKELPGLQTLNLAGCTSLKSVDGLKELPGLQTLDLAGCASIEKFGPLSALLPQLHSLSLFQCRFQDLRSEVCGALSGKNVFDALSGENVLDAVRAWYAEGNAHGWHADQELKVFILGNGGVGKTQLCRRLRGLPYDKNIKSTHGVQLDHMDVSLPGRAKPVRLNLWDFGGQDIYHGAHTLFLQGPAVFILLWTPSTEAGEYEEGDVKMRHRPLAYWLDYVRSVAGTENPLLIVQGRCDADEDQRPLPVPLPANSSSMRCLAFSAAKDKDEKKLKALCGALEEEAGVVLHRYQASDIPEGRIRLAQQLRQMLEDDKDHPAEERRRTLTREHFRRLCKENGQIEMPYWQEALRFLHLRGVVFWRPELFKGRIILDQSWALEAIYALFDRDTSLPVLCRDGRFTRFLLDKLVWKKRTEAEQRTFLGMMESCGICFRVRLVNQDDYDDEHAEWEYIAPELLPGRTSPEVQRQLISPVPEDASRAEVRYRFLHEGVLRAFLSWLGSYVGDRAVYWRFGCWFHDPESRVQVIIDSRWDEDRQHPGQGVVTLDAWGGQAVPLLEGLIAKLKTLSPVQEPHVERTVGASDNRCALDSPPIPDLIVESRSELRAFGPFHPLLARKRPETLQQMLHLAELVRSWPTEQAEVPDVCRALPPEKRRDNGPKEIGNHFKALERLCGPLSKAIKDGLPKRLLPQAQILDRLVTGIAEIRKALAWHGWQCSS